MSAKASAPTEPTDASTAAARRRATASGFVGAYSLSQVGDHLWLTTLGWSAAQLDQPTISGIVLAAGTLPRALLILFGGSLVDRYGIRLLAVHAQWPRAVIMCGAAVLGALSPDSWALLLLIAVVFGAADAVNVPALDAAPALLVRSAEVPRLSALLQTTGRLAAVLGAPAAGMLIAWGGVQAATLTCAVMFAVTLVILLRSRLPQRPSGEVGDEDGLRGGIRYVLTHPLLRTLIVVIGVLNFAIMATFNVGIPLLVHAHGWSATAYGVIEGCFGAGAVAGAMAVALRRATPRPAVVGLVWVAVQTPFLTAIGFFDDVVVAAALATVVGVTLGPASALLFGLVQASADQTYIGRVMSVVNFVTACLIPAAYFLFGVLVRVATLTTAFVATGVLEATVVAVSFALPALRNARRPSATSA